MSIIPAFSIENITPAVAEQYLSKNTKNRNLKEHAIKKYARDMEAGRWLMTGEAIKFDTGGNLLDGQNRLHAVIRSGATIQSTVIRGLEPESMKVMDIVQPRSGADSLKLEGFGNGKDLQAAANAHAAYSAGVFIHCMTGMNSSSRMTNFEVVDYARCHPSLVEAVDFATGFRKHLQLPVGALATSYDVLVGIDPEAARDFFSRIREMRTTGAGDPVATLIRRVADEKMRGRRIDVALGLYFIFRAWSAFRSGDSLGKFQIGSSITGWGAIPEPA